MKTKLIISIALMCLICTGCKKHECAELSWTDYNSVEDVWCNFHYFKEESKTYIGDTLKVYGWLYMGDDSKLYYSKLLISKKELQYCTNKSQLFSNPFVSLFVAYDPNNETDPMPDNPELAMLYVTGIISYDPEKGGSYTLKANKLETFIHEK
ncbi:MAG: hypothetical protein J6T88_08570 [Bacteroidales bacterium]|nr:hypothetical protein [Bacteroidales bacterium]